MDNLKRLLFSKTENRNPPSENKNFPIHFFNIESRKSSEKKTHAHFRLLFKLFIFPTFLIS